MKSVRIRRLGVASIASAFGLAGLGLGVIGGHALAQGNAPSEHEGLKVEKLGVIDDGSIAETVGLENHFLQLRLITIEPGGQIARHSHATRPGLVKVIAGEWVEGSPDGERTYGADDPVAILEDETTDHWFFNRGEEPATAVVCDLNPAG